MKKSIKYIYPILTIIAIFFLLKYANLAGIKLHRGAESYNVLIYGGLYVITGFVMIIDLWLCKIPTDKAKYYLAAERILLGIAIVILVNNMYMSTRLGVQVWGVVVGFEVATAILYILPHKKSKVLA